MQMTADPRFAHFGWHTSVDHLLHETPPYSLVSSQEASSYDYVLRSSPKTLSLPMTVVELSNVMDICEFTTSNIEVPPAQCAANNKPAMDNALAGQRPAEQGEVVEASGMIVEPSEANFEASLLRPTPADWIRWKPRIIEKYKHGTARVILEELQSEGFHVTDKMLRERFRQWRINTKNKRPISHASDRRIARHSTHGERNFSQAAASRGPCSALPTSPEDVLQCRLLSTIKHYFERAWALKLEEHDSRKALSLLYDMNDAIWIAANINSKCGWATLQKVGIELQQIDWSCLSPRGIVRLVQLFEGWGYRSTGIASNLRRLVKDHLSSFIGERHPIVLLMETALCRKLDLETCQRYIALADTTAGVNAADPQEKDSMNHDTRVSYLRVLLSGGYFKTMEETLDSWLPTCNEDRCLKLRYFAVAKRHSGEYNEAERLFSAALNTFDEGGANMGHLVNIISGYVRTMLDQKCPERAVEVFLDGLSRYEEVMKDDDDSTIAMDLDWLRMGATWWRSEFPDTEGLDRVIEKLDAMSLDT